MVRLSLSVSVVAALFFIISFGVNSAYGDQLLFIDDFSDGDAKDWQIQIGEWYVGGGAFCVADCGG